MSSKLEERLNKIENKLKTLEEENRDLKKENKVLRKHLDSRMSETKSEESSENTVSRRGFLKTLGAGAAGIGALAMVPSAASKISVTDSGITQDGVSFWNANTFSKSNWVKTDGTNPMTGALDMQNNNLVEPNQLVTGGGGTDTITVRDAANTQDLAVFNEGGAIEFPSGDITDGTNTIWDSGNSQVPLTALESTSITVTSGNGLKNGGAVSLGGSTTLGIEPADFAGAHLSDDGSDNLQVDDDFVLNTGDTITGLFTASSGIEVSGGDLDVTSGGFIGLPQRTSDTGASVGDIWYRSDLD